MYLKVHLENNETIYRDFSDQELIEILDTDKLYEKLSDLIEDEVDDWCFTDFPTTYSNVFHLDLKEVINKNPDYEIDGISVDKIEFLQTGSYEHAIASFGQNDPKFWDYSRKVEIWSVEKESEDYHDGTDPFGDD